jgi:hypothetical protein
VLLLQDKTLPDLGSVPYLLLITLIVCGFTTVVVSMSLKARPSAGRPVKLRAKVS